MPDSRLSRACITRSAPALSNRCRRLSFAELASLPSVSAQPSCIRLLVSAQPSSRHRRILRGSLGHAELYPRGYKRGRQPLVSGTPSYSCCCTISRAPRAVPETHLSAHLSGRPELVPALINLDSRDTRAVALGFSARAELFATVTIASRLWLTRALVSDHPSLFHAFKRSFFDSRFSELVSPSISSSLGLIIDLSDHPSLFHRLSGHPR